MTNTNLDTGIRYGIISANALDPDLVCTLQDRGRDVHWEVALVDLRSKVEREADQIEEEVAIAIAETDYSLVGNEEWEERSIEAAYVRLGYEGRDDYVDTLYEGREEGLRNTWYDDEPTHEGTYEDVKYRTTWLGGALLVWIFQSPIITHADLCSPCVPNAGSLECENPNGYECYGVPQDWRYRDGEA